MSSNYCTVKTSGFLSGVRYAIGSVVNIFDKDNRDGKIGKTKQGGTGDCWFLSAVNALNSTENGKKILENAISYEDDGILVEFNEDVGSFFIPNSEIIKTKGTLKYSSGDDDMIALELACESALNKMQKENISLNYKYSKSQLHIEDDEGDGLINGGSGKIATYLFTKNGATYKNKEVIEKQLNLLEADNSTNMAASFSLKSLKNVKLEDENGKKTKIYAKHEYTIKSVKGDKITIINPWDSGKDITISKKDFIDIVGDLNICNLADDENNLIMLDSSYNKDDADKNFGSIEYNFDENKKPILKKYALFDDVYDKKEVFSLDNKKIGTEQYLSGTQFGVKYKCNTNGNIDKSKAYLATNGKYPEIELNQKQVNMLLNASSGKINPATEKEDIEKLLGIKF